jgi:hypothetical protein
MRETAKERAARRWGMKPTAPRCQKCRKPAECRELTFGWPLCRFHFEKFWTPRKEAA